MSDDYDSALDGLVDLDPEGLILESGDTAGNPKEKSKKHDKKKGKRRRVRAEEFSLTTLFSERGWSSSVAPSVEDIEEFYDDDGELDGIRYIPKHLEGNNWEYFLSSKDRARLMRYLVATSAFLLAFASMTIQYPEFGTIGGLVVLFFIVLNMILRFSGKGYFGRFPAFSTDMIPAVARLRFFLRERSESEKDEDGEYTELIVSSSDPVGNVKSPGILLADWLNYQKWSISDVSERTNGGLAQFQVRMLLNDLPEAWDDRDTVFRLCELTRTDRKQWENARTEWLAAKEEQDQKKGKR